MSNVAEVLRRKASAHVHTIGKDATVLEAATVMNEHKIGSLVVVEDGCVVGIFTERDVLRRVVGEQREPTTTHVADVMTTELICCKPETTIEEARGAMKNRRVRHLPLVDQDYRLMGLISIGDLNAFDASNQEQTIYLLQEYLYGRV
jgi:CBS domain-containing protein